MNLLHDVQQRVLVADGAMGTQLQLAGLPFGECGDRWNLEWPERIETIHRAYLDAGSEVILTNSFGANLWVLERYGLADRVEQVNRRAAEIARQAAGPGRIVLGDVGPSGQLLEPLGPTTIEQVVTQAVRQVGALLEGGADAIIVETMMAIEEIVAVVGAALKAGAPYVIASMAFDRLPNGRLRTMMGVSPEQAARDLADAGAAVVGANCGTRLDVADFAELTAALGSASHLPVMIQPNAGQPRLDQGRAVYDLAPADFAGQMRAVIQAGASIVGGCCGTTPAHIAALRAVVA